MKIKHLLEAVKLSSRQLKFLEKHNIKNYTINSDGSIDVTGQSNIRIETSAKKIPINFNSVDGDFVCINTPNIETLEGFPKKVGGSFIIRGTKITTLEGGPLSVGGDYICDYNNLTTLKGSPKAVEDFSVNNNKLLSLEGGPETVNGSFIISNNKLKNLEGCPKIIKNSIFCSENSLETLTNIHKYINQIGELISIDDLGKVDSILGLIMVNGLVRILIVDNSEIEDIINKYLGKGRTGMLAAQKELIEAGYEEQAKL